MPEKLFQAVILAGGLATRLRPLTEKIPKSLIEINSEPFIAHQLRLLQKKGIENIVICAGFLGEMIEEFLGNGHRYNVNVKYVYDGKKLLGTAGAIKKAEFFLEEHFFLIYGDSYLECDYLSIQKKFQQSQQLALMTVFKNQNAWDKSNIEFKDQEIIKYDKKNINSSMHYIDYGLGILSKKVLTEIPNNEFFDLELLYQKLLLQKQLAAYEVNNRFYEIGSFAGIKDLENYLNT